MRISTLSITLILTFFIGTASAAPGDFDPTFGTNGQVFDTIANASAATDVAIQTDGKIVLAVNSFGADSTQDFAVVRLNANGTTDAGFGTNGKVDISFDNFADEITVAVVVQADGKILVVGFVEFGSPGWDFGVVRLNADGSLDTTFG